MGFDFHDDPLASAMIDRLAHHGCILFFEGESCRMKNVSMRRKIGVWRRKRIKR